MKKWESYEEVATYLLNQFAAEFGLDKVEGKQKVLGLLSGHEWEIDAKGIKEGGEGFIIVECRRYPSSRQNAGQLGQLAWTIIESGAEGGILVSPLGFQKGAAKVAKAVNVVEVRLTEDSSQYEFFMQFLNKVMVGVQDEIVVSIRNTMSAVPPRSENDT